MQRHQVEFHGKTGEYFGIWIVNVLLTIITLGIYGAWAKVRDNKYMYGSTFIDDHSFDYHATGKQIFIGRVIVAILLMGLAGLSYIDPILYLIGLFGLLLLIPYIICRALRFNARVTSYRNVRFDFVGKVGKAFVTFFVIPIANIFTLYLCTPFVSRAVHSFVTNNSRFGDRPMHFASGIGNYYKPFLIAILISIVGLVILSLFGGMMTGMFGAFKSIMESTQNGTPLDPATQYLFIFLIMGMYLGLFLVIIPASLIYRAMMRNVLFNHTVVDDLHHLNSKVHPGRFIWIVITNALLSLVTIGLMIPWGRIRLAKYMASVTAIDSEGSLEGYTSNVQETAGVLSAEYLELEGIEIDIGI